MEVRLHQLISPCPAVSRTRRADDANQKSLLNLPNSNCDGKKRRHHKIHFEQSCLPTIDTSLGIRVLRAHAPYPMTVVYDPDASFWLTLRWTIGRMRSLRRSARNQPLHHHARHQYCTVALSCCRRSRRYTAG